MFFRVTVCCTWVLLLVVASASIFGQKSDQSSQPILTTPKYNIYSLNDPTITPLAGSPGTFGVLLINAKPNDWDLQGCSACYQGSTGHKWLVSYGGSDTVVDFAREHEVEDKGSVWVATKPKTVIDLEIFKKGKPAEFEKSVNDDIQALAFAGDVAGTGQTPGEKQQKYAQAAVDDLSYKSRWYSMFKDSPVKPPPLIKVIVHTLKSGKEISKWTVSYVIAGWEGDQAHTRTFDNESSPTAQDIPPGRYVMWASQGSKTGPPRTVYVGDTPSLTREIQLEVERQP